MEGHGLPRADVIALLTEGGASVREVEIDVSPGPQWVSYRYCVVKM